MGVNSETTPETDIAGTLSQNTGSQIMRDKFDELAYTFWSIHPKDIPVDGTMPDNHPGGFRAWFYAQEMRAALPDMVVPLVWSDWSDEYCIQTWNRLAVLAKAKTEIGEYRIGRKHDYIKSTNPQKRAFDSVYSSEWYVDAPFSGFLLGPFKGDVEAKKVAQAHHVAQSLSAFGITPPGTREDT